MSLSRMGLRWRLVAVTSITLALVCAVTFSIVYQRTTSSLRGEVDDDVHGDLNQLTAAARSLPAATPARLAARLRDYIRAQPPAGASSVLFAHVRGYPVASSHPQLFAAGDHGPIVSRAAGTGARLLAGPVALRTASLPDIGTVRVAQRQLGLGRAQVRLGAGEALQPVTRAQRSISRAFLIAGLIGLILVLGVSWLAGWTFAQPLRRLSRVAEAVDDGELHPTIRLPRFSAPEIRVLADAFDHMLLRLAEAFANQQAFVADASHELRTPLTVISGQIELLGSEPDPSAEEVRRVTRVVAGEIARTARLVEDMLLLASADHADFVRREAIWLPDYVTELWAASTAGRQGRFTLSFVPRAHLDADPDRLAQLLRNLIDNAVAHTDAAGGHVRLTVEAVGSEARFSVLDNGPGIAEQDRVHVFERFYRTDEARDRAHGGAGLGLSIVAAIAAAHGGAAVAEPGPEGGARLIATIPGLTCRSSAVVADPPSAQAHV